MTSRRHVYYRMLFAIIGGTATLWLTYHLLGFPIWGAWIIQLTVAIVILNEHEIRRSLKAKPPTG